MPKSKILATGWAVADENGTLHLFGGCSGGFMSIEISEANAKDYVDEDLGEKVVEVEIRRKGK